MNLLIATPCLSGQYERTFMLSLIDTLWTLNKNDISVIWKDIPYCSDLVLARAKIFGEFWRNEKYTHLLMIDADMGWDGVAVVDLIKMNREFLAVPGPKKKYPLQYCTNEIDGITYVGMGFVMINRECAKKLVEAYPDKKFIQDDIEEHGLFDTITTKDESRLSEDYSFCHRWGLIGGKIDLLDIRLTHTGAHTFGNA